MCRASGDKQVRQSNLEKALAESPETYGHLDLIAFGFPCQDISGANPKGKGVEGQKSSIFFECMRIVQLLIPQWILIENVPRLLSIHKGKDFGIVLQTLAESGYGYCWNVLDSQWFGVPQRRKRLFIAGRFGGFCPAEILSEPAGSCRDNQKNGKVSERGLCLTTRSGSRHDPTAETFVASTIQATDYKKSPHGQYGNECNLIASTIKANSHEAPSLLFGDTIIANTIKCRPESSFPPSQNRQFNLLAETNPNRERETSGPARGLDTARGVVIGNAVTVQVVEWIGRRIKNFDPDFNRDRR